jgi:hypothetical protein
MLVEHASIHDDDELGKDHLRVLYSLHLERLSDYPGELKLKSPHFVAFLALDATSVTDQDILAFASRALTQGAVWFCIWGPDCKRVHDLIDDAIRQDLPEETDETLIFTSWHENDELADAVWFGMYTAAFPAPAYADSFGAALFVTVSSTEWATRIDRWLSDPKRPTWLVLRKKSHGKLRKQTHRGPSSGL